MYAMRTINILYFISGLSMGGIEVALYRNLCFLDREKYRVTVISLTDMGQVGEKIKQHGIPVYAIGMSRGRPTPSSLARFLKLMNTCGRPDIVQGWDYHGNFAAILSNFMMGWKSHVIWGIHHTPYDLKQERKLTALMINMGVYFSILVNRIVYVSSVSKTLHETLGYNRKISHVIPNGFDLYEFRPSIKARFSIRSELKVGQDVFLVGLFARFHPAKDHENFLKAAGLISQKRENVYFLLAGKNINEDNKVIMDLIKNNNLESKVILLGERSDVSSLMASIDILTVSSAWEAFPIVIGEAMSCGVPCVVTDVGDSGRIVGQTGIVVPPRAPKSLADAWEKLFSLSQLERQELGIRARQRIEENYTIQGTVKAYESLYEEVYEANL
jgi:glycosyltransferase involved in cell wall biosynthesis